MSNSTSTNDGAFETNEISTIIFEYVFPWVGVLIGNMMYAAPWKDVLDASLTGDLGVLNPLPWAFMTGNCFGWLVYGMLVNNLSIVSGAAPGLLLSIWLNLQAVKLQYARSYSTEMRKVLLQNTLEGQTVEFARNSGASEAYQALDHDDEALTDIDEEEERSGQSIDEEHGQKLPLPLHLQQQQLQEQRPPVAKEERIRRKSQQGQLDGQTEAERRTSFTPQQLASSVQQSPRPSQVIRVEQTMKAPEGVGDFDLLVLNVHSSMRKIKTTATQENMLLIVCTIWVLIILCLAFIPNVTKDQSITVVGIAVNLNLVIFYGAPLSTIYTVVTTRVSESIHIPTMILNSLNGGLWGVFGLVTGDPYVTLPNSMGFLLGIVQMVLCLIYPRELKPIDSGSGDGDTNSRSARNRRTIVMISSQNLNDMESLSVLSLVHPSKENGRHSISQRGSRVYSSMNNSFVGHDHSSQHRYSSYNVHDRSQNRRKSQRSNVEAGSSRHYRNQVSDFLEAIALPTQVETIDEHKVARLWL